MKPGEQLPAIKGLIKTVSKVSDKAQIALLTEGDQSMEMLLQGREPAAKFAGKQVNIVAFKTDKGYSGIRLAKNATGVVHLVISAAAEITEGAVVEVGDPEREKSSGMRVTELRYERTTNLGNFCSEKIGLTIELEPGVTASEALANAKKFIDKYGQKEVIPSGARPLPKAI